MASKEGLKNYEREDTHVQLCPHGFWFHFFAVVGFAVFIGFILGFVIEIF